MIRLHSRNQAITDMQLMDHIMVTIKEEVMRLKAHLMTISSIGIGTMYNTVMVLRDMMSLTIVRHYNI